MSLDQLSQYLDGNLWIAHIFVIVFCTLLVDFIQRIILRKLINKFKNTKNFWDHSLLLALQKPLIFMIWLIGTSLALQVLQAERETALFTYIQPLLKTFTIVIVAWFIVRLIRNIQSNLIAKKRFEDQGFDQTTTDAISKLLSVSVIITAFLVILQTLGYSISGVLAFGGVGGIAIGFAARDLLANFFGGLMIYMDRPFKVGDWIRSPDKEIEGTVEKIGWRVTTIRTFDKRPLYVPNSVFTSISVENPSRMSNRRIKETIGIRYDDASKMDDIVKDVKQMLKEHQEIDTSQTLIVNFNAYAPSSLDFFIYTFTKTTDWIRYHEIKQDVMLKILNIIESHDAECAFPTSTLHIPEMNTNNAV